MGEQKKHYREVFLANAQPQPWPCHFCEEPVWLTEFVAHHLDEDHDNFDPSNLVPAHKRCHQSHHKTKEWELGIGIAHPDARKGGGAKGRPQAGRLEG